MDCNALETLVPCLEEFDPTVKEAASWAIGYIAQHTAGDSPLMVYFDIFFQVCEQLLVPFFNYVDSTFSIHLE